ncbi:hypothetical protein A9Q83_04320 [Alphaproteobacteria bacterium 46_93_T64]|nr:hypothetical protein A9Q83_04320 [Alphaproteobacteria bacterium 46_93_T64]
MQHEWQDISSVPEKPGVYAWYYRPEITNSDLDRIITKVASLTDKKDRSRAVAVVTEFLDSFLFNSFRESSYRVAVKGALKPQYEGSLKHVSQISTSLAERLAAAPERFRKIKEVVEASAPEFTSPLYIGMSSNLRRRLSNHRRLIEKYRLRNDMTSSLDLKEENASRDKNFAMQVVRRKMAPTRLFVVTHVIECDEQEYKDVENILNRINYPLLGRN